MMLDRIELKVHVGVGGREGEKEWLGGSGVGGGEPGQLIPFTRKVLACFLNCAHVHV